VARCRSDVDDRRTVVAKTPEAVDEEVDLALRLRSNAIS